MERDGLSLDFTLFDVDFVSGEHNGDVLADTDKVAWVMQDQFVNRIARVEGR